MKPISSILTVGALLAFAGRVVAAPVPNDAPVEAKHTEIVWHTVYHTTYVAVTKTEWVDPPTTTPTTATTADEETTTTTTTTPTTTSKTTRTTETTTEEEYTTTSTTSTTTTSSTTTTTSSTTTEEETSTTETPTPTQPKPDIKVELPTTTPTPEPEPTPTPTPEPEPTPTPTPEPEPKPKTSSTDEWEGDATYYDPGMGSCGVTNTKDDMIAAISYEVMDPLNPGNPNNNPLCGKMIECYRADQPSTTEKTKIKVVDRCPVCKKGDLDLSPAAYAALGGTIAEGRFRIKCNWVY